MRAVWTPRARRDVAGVLTHIAKDDPGAAGRLNERLLDLIETTLAAQPNSGRPGRVAGTREMVVHPGYILAYRVEGTTLQLLAFRHATRLWPDRF